MVRFVLCLGFFAACAVAQEQAQIQEQHLRESGSAAVLAHSTFAHGYRHGYEDGYLGHTFRAVDNLRAVATSLDASPSAADPHHTYFDQGFFTGYNDGFERGGSDHSSTAQVDFHFVGCSQLHQTSQGELPAQGRYCEGYRRGFALGHADGFVLRPDAARLEASK